MKKVVLFIGICLFVFTTVAQTTRTVIQIGDSDWKWIERTENFNPVLVSELSMNQLADIDSLTTSMSIVTELDVDQNDSNRAVLNLFGCAGSYEVYVNGVQLINELSIENFHAEITSYAEEGKIVLMLNPIINQSVRRFEEMITNSAIIFLKGVVLCHLDVKTDPYFCGKLIEVCIDNFLDKDVEGKIYARLYTADTWELIAENNNCAFSRSGLEGNIEINFPDFDSKYEGKPLIAELVMVDKDKDEAIIDQLTTPVHF